MNNTEKPLITISFNLNAEEKDHIESVLSPIARIIYIKNLNADDRAKLLQTSHVVLAWAPHTEFSPTEITLLEKVKFMQLLSAGADHLDFSRLPANLTVASNVGAYAQPMAEHVLAMVLALAKRLYTHHEKLKQGIFDQFSENKSLSGTTAAILGFGGIGREVARLFKPFNMHILAINRSGKSPDPAEFLGTPADMDKVLPLADIIVITLPLNRATRGLIGEHEFKLMKPDAVLVNVGRGEIIDEEAFYHHLKNTPTFMAGIDAWWTEPFRHGHFEMKYPFLDLPNVLGTPHNSALVHGALASAAQKAAENIRRFLLSEPITGLVQPEDYE